VQRGLFVSLAAALLLSLSTWSSAISAQERNDSSPSQTLYNDAAQSSSPELAPLPVSLTVDQIRALQPLPPFIPGVKSFALLERQGFYRGAFNRPLTPRQVTFRETVYALAARHNQFVHVRLVNGKVLTGTISWVSPEAFLVQTDVLGNCDSVHYHQLAEPPRPVLAAGTRAVRGLETTGLVVLCVVALPLAVVVYPLIAAGVLQD
jgi:hypothetical protein